MSKPIKCDVCGRCNDEYGVYINKSRHTTWWKDWTDWQWRRKFDICEYCWEGWRSFMQNRLAAKCPTEPKL